VGHGINYKGSRELITVIGRKKNVTPGLHINLHNISKLVSRTHSTIEWSHKGYFILRNLGRNGTLLNDKPLFVDETRRLREGDVIEIGKVKLTFSSEK